jgi:hypothetical protein
MARLALLINIKHLILSTLSSSCTMGTTDSSTNTHDHASPAGTCHTESSSSTYAKISHSRVQSHGIRADFAILATTLDTFVAILIQIGEVLPELLIGGMDDVSVLDGSELGGQSTDCSNVEFVLV